MGVCSSEILHSFDWWLFTDVLGQPIFKGSAVKENAWLLKMGPIDCPETSLSTNQRFVTSQKNEGLIQFFFISVCGSYFVFTCTFHNTGYMFRLYSIILRLKIFRTCTQRVERESRVFSHMASPQNFKISCIRSYKYFVYVLYLFLSTQSVAAFKTDIST